MQLPASFIDTIRKAFKEDGEKFLAVFPALVDEFSKRWGLTDVQPVPNLSFNFVAFAKHTSTAQNVILKMGVPNNELRSEIAALKLFNGNGACQLLESDEERGVFLLERLNPGTMLAELKDDDERTHIAADVMQRLWRVAPEKNNFIQLSDWFGELKTVRPKFDGGTGPFPKEIFERVESFLPELFADTDMKLIHGDFHHFNILKSEERGWLVIDPKGVIGPAGYEVGPLMINPWGSLSDGISFKVQTERRIDIFRERLGWERENLIRWSLAHSVLSAWWDFESDLDWEYSMNCAKVFAEIK
ncbi:MAG: phosphotransferase [Anaerolineales bacterium]|nr:phosphotransferase [Anaerolineales bacterium]